MILGLFTVKIKGKYDLKISQKGYDFTQLEQHYSSIGMPLIWLKNIMDK